MKKLSIILLVLIVNLSFSQKKQEFTLKSPNGKIEIRILVNDKISWTISHEKDVILAPSAMSLTLGENQVLGKNAVVLNSKTATINASFDTPFYKKKSVKNNYNQLIINFKNDFSIEYRAFDDGVAYLLLPKRKKTLR